MPRLAVASSPVAVAIALAATAAGLGLVRAQPVDDPRRVVEVPPAVAAELRAEMRDHMATLDDLVGAVAFGEFDEAAAIAEARMRVGHRLDERLAERGYAPEEIERFRAELRAQGWEPGRGPGDGLGPGLGPGRYVPEDFRAMGMAFHEAATQFAATAREVGDPPTTADYENVLSALQFVTSTCRSCHATFKLAR